MKGLPAGTIVRRTARSVRVRDLQARIIAEVIRRDRTGRGQPFYEVERLDTLGAECWPASHCEVVAPAPAH